MHVSGTFSLIISLRARARVCVCHGIVLFQIRVHAKHLVHPLLGDETYNGARICYGPQNTQRQRLYNDIFANILPRPALHAASLALDHPLTEERIQTRSLLPDDMTEVIELLGGDAAAIDAQLYSGSPHEKQPNVQC